MRLCSRLLIVTACLCSGCRREFNPTPTAGEGDCLSQVIQLTSDFQRAGEAYFSPDMSWVVFQAVPTGEQNHQMYVAPVRSGPDGITVLGTPIRITPQSTWNSCGFFSPDGKSLIFSSTAGRELVETPQSGYQRQGGTYRWSFPSEADIFHVKGWQGAIAGVHPSEVANLAKDRLTDNVLHDAECSFSPGGKWIVFTSNRTGDQELWVMRADGSNPVQLTTVPGYDGGAFFSPDGYRLLYRSDRQGNNLLQIFVADLVFNDQGNITGISNERQLTNDANVNWGPFWHPDGRHIVYATSAHGHTNYELYLMRGDGSRKTRLTFAAGADVLPVFSPDGKYLMWSSTRHGPGAQLYLAKFKLPKGS
jgi:Tol biopolymer transport system component